MKLEAFWKKEGKDTSVTSGSAEGGRLLGPRSEDLLGLQHLLRYKRFQDRRFPSTEAASERGFVQSPILGPEASSTGGVLSRLLGPPRMFPACLF